MRIYPLRKMTGLFDQFRPMIIEKSRGERKVPILRIFEVNIKPRGQGRPRARMIPVTKGGKKTNIVTMYKAHEDVDYEKQIREAYLRTYAIARPLPDVLEVEIITNMFIGEKATKSTMKLLSEGKVFPAKKPDIDNIAKAVLDALNKVAWEDDRQIVKLTVEKLYVDKKEDEGLVVGIRTREGVGE